MGMLLVTLGHLIFLIKKKTFRTKSSTEGSETIRVVKRTQKLLRATFLMATAKCNLCYQMNIHEQYNNILLLTRCRLEGEGKLIVVDSVHSLHEQMETMLLQHLKLWTTLLFCISITQECRANSAYLRHSWIGSV